MPPTNLERFQRLINTTMAEHSPSPLARWLGGTLRHAEPGKATFVFTVREEMTNPAGILHGGAAAVNLTVDFLASAPAGATITATTQVVRQGKTIINVECWLHDAAGVPLAHATSNMLRTTVPVRKHVSDPVLRSQANV